MSPIAMSLSLGDLDAIATCLVPGCDKQLAGDALSDAAVAWVNHVAADHADDWGDET